MNDDQRARDIAPTLLGPDAANAAAVDLAVGILRSEFAAVRENERQRLRGSEVIPLARHLAECGRCADTIIRERKWAYRADRISLIVQGCRLAWPDVFAEADRIEFGP